MSKVNFITKKEFYETSAKIGTAHWQCLDYRWDYHKKAIEILKTIDINSPSEVLEMGTMGINLVKGSHVIDYDKNWVYENKQATYWHDARIFPWPIKDKQYKVFVALRVFQHLVPKQKEAFIEAKRISEHIIICVDEKYNVKEHPESQGISLNQFIEWNNGIYPTKVIPSKMGTIYYWNLNCSNDNNNFIGRMIERLLFRVKYKMSFILFKVKYKMSLIYKGKNI